MSLAPYDKIAADFSARRTRLTPKEVEYLSLLLAPLPAGSSILDLGCGSGHPIATHLVSLGYQVIGVDGSEAMLAIARQQLPEQRWIHAAIEAVQFEERFAAVICWDALFHLPRQHFPAVVGKIHRWLDPGGRLMVSSGGAADTAEGFTDTMFGHEFFYDSLSPAAMVALIEETGFEIILAEMCNLPDGQRDRGKWATIAAKITPDQALFLHR